MQNREFCLGDGFVLSENLENSIQLRKVEKMRLVNTIIFVIYCHVCITLQVFADFQDNPTNITILTAENAKELVETNQRILLAEFQHSLYFPKVTKINQICARELAMFDGWELALNGLIEMDKDVAKELVTMKAQILTLGMKLIDRDTAQELAKTNANSLALGLTSINKDVAHELAQYDGVYLGLSDLGEVNQEIAKELARSKAAIHDLSGIRSIDKKTAAELCQFKSEYLYLNGLQTINKDVTKELIEFEHTLFLGITSIDKEVAEELVNFKGEKLIAHALTVEKDIHDILVRNEDISFYYFDTVKKKKKLSLIH